MFRTMSQFILRDSINYDTSYLRMVLIKIYNILNILKYISWVIKISLTVLSFGHCISTPLANKWRA
jgi:hypothetical protein